MLMRRVIPCLDVCDGRIVKGVRFGALRDAGDPAERAQLYADEGADEIVLLDVSATREGRAASVATVARVRERIGVPLCVGGGVRTLDDAQVLFDAGADKVAVNTAAVARPALVGEIAGRFGAQACVVAIDAARAGGASSASVVSPEDSVARARERSHELERSARAASDEVECARAGRTERLRSRPSSKELSRALDGTSRPDALVDVPAASAWRVVTHAGTRGGEIDAVAWAREASDRGAGELLLTAWDRDGTRTGYEIALVRAVASAVRIAVIASGGAANAAHLADALRAGADAVLAASIFHDGEVTVADVKRALAEQGVEVRR